MFYYQNRRNMKCLLLDTKANVKGLDKHVYQQSLVREVNVCTKKV